MDFARVHPYVYYAAKYVFHPDQTSLSRHCYSAAIYFVTAGKGRYRSQGREYEASLGMMVYTEPGQGHNWESHEEEPLTLACCFFDWQYLDRSIAFPDLSLPSCTDSTELRPAFIGAPFPYPLPEISNVGTSLRYWLNLLQKCYISSGHASERTFLRSLAVQRHFMQFIDYFLTFSLDESSLPDPRIMRLLPQMEADILDGVRLQPEEYAETLRVSRGYFFELFKQTTGMSPLQYTNQLLMNRAKDDLCASNLSIPQIAEKYHFKSVHYFSRLFRQYTGKSPQSFLSLRQ